jgi:hypothetical protein
MTTIRIAPEMRRVRHAESTDRSFRPSRHSSRQNGESGGAKRRISGYPAVFPAILRDRSSSAESSPLTEEKRTQILGFKPVEFDGFNLNAIAIRQMRTLTARNLKQLEGGAP